MRELKEQIKALREKKGMTQKELAMKLGVSRPTVTLWERGVNRPRTTMLVDLANALSCDVGDLLCS